MSFAGTQYEIASGSYRAVVSEVGANLAGLWFDGQPVTVAGEAGALPRMSSGAVLMPWPNRIRDGKYDFDGVSHQLPLSEPTNHNASHGLVRWERWERAENTDTSVTLALDVVPQTGYEFQIRLRIQYEMSPTGLTVTVRASNLGTAPAPFGVGFHPYLDLTGYLRVDGDDVDAAQVGVPAMSVLLTDDQQIPIERRPVEQTPYDLREPHALGALRVDHCFTDLIADRASVSVGNRTTQLWWDDGFGYLQVFTPPLARFGRPAIAMEPMTCPADAFNSGTGLLRLVAGQPWTGRWGIACSG